MHSVSAPHQGPIGVFDSGLGGLTVAAAIAAALPQESMVYLGDTARVPYGSRSPDTIVRYAHNNLAFLRSQGVKLVVIACNTVSAQDLSALRREAPMPIIEVIGPGAQAALAASAGGAIAVLGTRSTIRSGAYVRALHRTDPDRAVHSIACPLLVPLVEEGFAQHPVTAQIIEEYLRPLAHSEVDTLVLGCTHYPLLRGPIAQVAQRLLGRPVRLVDSAQIVAQQVSACLKEQNLLALGPARHRFFVTDHPERTEQLAAQFWGDAVGAPIGALEQVDLIPGP